MAAKHRKRPKTGGRGGRKSISSGEDPLLEERVEFVADLIAGFKPRCEIVKICTERYKIGDAAVDRYIAEVRRRWREHHDDRTIGEKRAELITSLRRVALKAEERVTYGEDGTPHENPDLWLVRAILNDIAKIEGLAEGDTPTDGDLDTVINDLTTERASGNPTPGSD